MMQQALKLILTPTLLLAFVGMNGQQTPASPAPAKQQMQNAPGSSSSSNTDAGQTSDLASLIKALSGRWSLQVKFEPSPEMPKGLTSSGEETWRPAIGGLTLLEEERVSIPAGDLSLLGIIWWDTKAKGLHGMECNNQAPYTCDIKGALNDITMTWDGKQFTINEWETHDNKKTLWHEVWSDITPTSYTQTGDVQEPGGSTTRIFTIQASKMEASH
jgi:hypothetical protein